MLLLPRTTPKSKIRLESCGYPESYYASACDVAPSLADNSRRRRVATQVLTSDLHGIVNNHFWRPAPPEAASKLPASASQRMSTRAHGTKATPGGRQQGWFGCGGWCMGTGFMTWSMYVERSGEACSVRTLLKI